MTATRTLVSMLVLAAGLFYVAAAVKGVGWLLEPPPDVVTTANGQGTGTPPTESPGSSGSQAVSEAAQILFRPLAVTGASLAGLLLVWAGCRGLRSRRDQRRWRTSQFAALGGLATGVFGFALGFAAAGSSHATYVDASWIGLEPSRPSAALALLIGAIAVLVPAGVQGHRPADRCAQPTPGARP
ncbi:hypothetical protein [Actinomadura sp. NBRC 104412]|uniref:hypothetical protein n=1 Tax=Actinomadura sp. NBRC 104412 TaxID=3032203 RepID=UPI0025545EDC|nr:hypothetical protein [Actinomadura sp. NBRC 104412]